MVVCICMMLIFAVCCGCGSNSVYSSIECAPISFSDASDFTDVASSVAPAIVGIGGVTNNGTSVGSGVCVSSNGYILTNSHVIHGCKSIDLYLSDKSNASAKIIYDDPISDLAIIRSNRSIPYLMLGDSDALSLGQEVLAVGTPMSLTLSHTFTKGIISSLNRTLKVGGDNGEGLMQNLIQHDASLNPGNSGGPLLNIRGEIVGINTLKISGGEGIGFAIPTRSFASLLASYISSTDYDRPYMGLYGCDTDIANFQGLTSQKVGFYVIDVSGDSPLRDFGVSRGAIILQLGGEKINNTLDLKNALYKYDASDFVDIVFSQNGSEYLIKTQLNKLNKDC